MVKPGNEDIILIKLQPGMRNELNIAAKGIGYGSVNACMNAMAQWVINKHKSKQNPTASQALQTKREEIQNMEKNIKG